MNVHEFFVILILKLGKGKEIRVCCVKAAAAND